LLEGIVRGLAIITGRAPVRKRARRVANFGLRQGQEISAAMTLRGADVNSSIARCGRGPAHP
jgi:ribosomal protein L5